MKVGIPKEIYPHECRVAATPDTVEKMVKLGLEVVVEAGAGEASSFADAAYIEAGARLRGARGGFHGPNVPEGPPPDPRARGGPQTGEPEAGTHPPHFLLAGPE